MIKCEICQQDMKFLGSHIRWNHEVFVKDYYDTYFLQTSKNCLICNKITKFINLQIGYAKYCSKKCMSIAMSKGLVKNSGMFKQGNKSNKKDKTYIELYGSERAIQIKQNQSKVRKEKCANGEILIWSEGLTKETDTKVKKMAENPERRQNIGESVKKQYANGDRINPFKGQTKETNASLMKISITMKENWSDPEYINKIYSNRKNFPNKLEMKAADFFNNNFPGEYSYTGNGNLWFTSGKKHLNPDFINKEKQKVIEILGLYWHSLYSKEIERRDLYQNIGYDCLLIYDFEFYNKMLLLNRIKQFHLGGDNINV